MWTAQKVSGLVTLAVGMIACVDVTQPTSTGPSYEGAKVSMTGTSSISIPTLDGRVVSATTREWAVDAVVENGIAEAARSPVTTDSNGPKMPMLYISDDHPLARGRANHRLLVSGKDLKGNAEDFVFVNGDAGPAKTIIHVGANRLVDEAYSFEWKKVRGGWRAMAFTATVFRNGKVLAQIRSANKLAPPGPSLLVASDDPCQFDATAACAPTDPTFGGGSGGGGGAAGCSCASQLQDYLLASGAASTATQAAIDSGTALLPWVALALAVAWAAAGTMLYRYNSCVEACRQATASSGEGVVGDWMIASVDRYYLRPA